MSQNDPDDFPTQIAPSGAPLPAVPLPPPPSPDDFPTVIGGLGPRPAMPPPPAPAKPE